MRLAAAGVLPVMLDAVLLTHLHSDHICDLGRRGHDAVGHEPGGRSRCGSSGRPGRSRSSTGAWRCWRPTSGTGARTTPISTGIRSSRSHEIAPGVVLDEGARADHRRGHRSPTGRTDARVPRRARGQRRGARGRHRAVRGARRAVRGGRRVRADRAPRRPREHGADATIQRHDRLPLDGRAGRRRPRPGAGWARSCSRTRSRRPRPVPPTSGSRSWPATSTARSSSATISPRHDVILLDQPVIVPS